MKIIPSLFSLSLGNSWAHFRHYGIAIIIFLIGLFLSLIAFRLYETQDLNRTRTEFDHAADLRIFLIRNVLFETLEQIETIKQFYYASNEVTPQDFHIFVHHSFKDHPNLLMWGWIAAHPPEHLPKKSALGLKFVDLTQPSSSSQFFPFTYFEKGHPHQPLDIDYSAYPLFLDLLQKSSQSPLIVTVSTAVNFFQDEKKRGFFLFKPILFEEMERPLRDSGIFGTIVGFSNFEDVIQSSRNQLEPLGINIGLYDLSDGTEKLLYWSPAEILKDYSNLSLQDRQLEDQWAHEHIFEFGNRTWKLRAIPTLGFIHQRHNMHGEVPIIGILISGLTASYFFILANRRRLIEQEVRERTNQLATINTMLQQEIHERQRIEEDFTRQQRYLQRRHEALEYLTKLTTSELRNTIHEVILRTATVMQIDRVSVWFYETTHQTQRLSCAGLYILSTHSFSNHLEFTSTYFPHYFKTLSKQYHLMIPSSQDAELNQELSSYLAVFHITSKLDIPIVFEGKLLGLLSCEETRGQREWMLEDRHFGQTIADVIAIMIEQSARRKAEKALQESEERLRFITQKAIDGIISVNDQEEIISWNFGAERMFGYHEKEIIEKSIRNIIPHDEFLIQEISNKSIELKGQHKDGHLFPVEISHTRWKSGELYFSTIIIRDITERKENEKRLIKAMREAKAANEAKNEFLATISHELRTPLNAIIGFTQCLLLGMDGSINATQETSLKRIEKSSFHLLNLISDILDLAKIEAQRMELEVMPYNIVDIVVSCVEDMHPLAKQKNLEISLSTPASFILIELDKMRIRQVLLNLLSNAIKFTEKGSIKVTIINDPSHVEIQLMDTGIGLSPEEIEKIFHPFSQADSSITRKYGGTGLGLVISKKIIDLHGGTIRVESQKGKGSTFTIILPKVE
jgi:PAS domain S-box-containing protein